MSRVAQLPVSIFYNTRRVSLYYSSRTTGWIVYYIKTNAAMLLASRRIHMYR